MNRVPKLAFYMTLGTFLYPIVAIAAIALQFTMWVSEPILKLFDKCIIETKREWEAIIEEKDE